MNRLVGEIVAYATRRMRSAMHSLQGDGALRSVFHGPPIRFLSPVLSALQADGGVEVILGNGHAVMVPVLLPVDALDPGEENPLVGLSGRCDQSHILALRNTPACPRFLALAAPARQSILSIAQATDEFGMSPANNSGGASIADWWGDGFVRELVQAVLRRHEWTTDTERHHAERLLELAVQAADEADRHDPQRPHAWAAIARVFSITDSAVPFPTQWSLACGFPPLAEPGIDADRQMGALSELTRALVDEGFSQCVERLDRNASDLESQALEECREYLQQSCDVPIALTRSAPYFYSPFRDDSVGPPPAWWSVLTAERLAELLEEDRTPPGALLITCTGVLVPGGHGLPAIVPDAIELIFSLPGDVGGPVDANVVRQVGPKANNREWNVRLPTDEHVVDSEPPNHRQPIRYTVDAVGFRKGSVKAVSLRRWEPGVVVSCRSATRTSLPKAPVNAGGGPLECDVELAGEGRHYLDLHVAPGVTIGPHSVGEDTATGAPLEAAITQASDGLWGMELFATPECYYDVDVISVDGSSRRLRIQLTCDDLPVEGCKSEFDRMIRLNRHGGRGALSVHLDRQVRVADLQGWILDPRWADRSFYPIALGSDCSDAWRAPDWTVADLTVLSGATFLHDPRPRFDEFVPPAEFVRARLAIAAKIRGEDGHGMVEAAEFGGWMKDRAFAEDVDTYVRSYLKWLEAEPDVAAWVDTAIVCGTEGDGRTLAQKPDAVVVSPLHPLRIGWQCLAQAMLWDAWRAHMPCPAASILDPDSVPDAIVLPLRLPNGSIERTVFLSTECSSDYWAVLWNGSRLERLAVKGELRPFSNEFGIELGGVSSGFSESQVRRALDDVTSLLSAKPILNLVISSSSGHGSTCNDGVITWVQEQFADREPVPGARLAVGPRGINVFDERSDSARPEDAAIANLAEDTGGVVKWFRRTPEGAKPDLGIIAQLETSNTSSDPIDLASPLGIGGLLRHRVRTQLQGGSGAFLSESRMGVARSPSGDSLADNLMGALVRLENLVEQRHGYTFAPSVSDITKLLRDKNAEYVAVSSSAVDPACFLGGWLEDMYLWDYELPSYSHRAGDTNGYYLLSKVKSIDCDALGALLARLPGCAGLPQDAVEEILLEVARRGIPTVRGLSAGHSGASGDLGLFVASRLLQDDFRRADTPGSMVSVLASDDGRHDITLVVPVDPFRGYLWDLQRTLGVEQFLRPDLLVVGLVITESAVRTRFTPVEVKYRHEEVMSQVGTTDALEQAQSLSKLLLALKARGDTTELVMWRLAYQHLLLSICDFGFRVYSQQVVAAKNPAEWSRMHQQTMAAILSEELQEEIDPIGRLIVFDKSASSSTRDIDEDGFNETMVVCPADASKVVGADPREFYDVVHNAVGDWRLFPSGTFRISASTKELTATGIVPTSGPIPVKPSTLDGEQPDTGGAPAPERMVRDAEIVAVEYGKSQGDTEGAVAGAPSATPELEPVAAPRGLEIRVGTAVDSLRAEPVFFRPSETTLNQLNIGVVGDLGTGKTQLVKSLVCQITRGTNENRGVRPRFMIFDYKKDYAADDFVQAVGARVQAPQHLPLNLFDISKVSSVNSIKPWMDQFRFFADVLDKIYGGVGPVQRENLKSAVRDAYQSCGQFGRQPTIYDVHDKYRALLKGKVDSLLSIISDMVDMELFAHDADDLVDVAKFLDGTVVLSLAAVDDRTRDMLVAIMLNMFSEQMLRTPKRPYVGDNPQLRVVDSYLLVDEADNIMRYDFDVLRKILLQGREFGVGVILASQYLKHFKSGGMDYREPLLTWFIHKVPTISPLELSTLGLTGSATTFADRIRELGNHQFLYKTVGVPGEVVQGLPFYKLVAE